MVSGILILLIFCLDVGSKLNYFPNLKDGMYKYLAVIQKTVIKIGFWYDYWFILNTAKPTWEMTLRYLAHLFDSIRTLWYLSHLLADNFFVPAVLTIFKKVSRGHSIFLPIFSMACSKSSIFDIIS